MKKLFATRALLTLLTAAGLLFSLAPKANLQTENLPKELPTPFPIKRAETPETWRRNGEAAIETAKNLKQNNKRAKNVILFIGDGMGITTLTASRILEG